MITETPTAEDFRRASVNLLNLAWQIAMESLKTYDQSEVFHPIDTPERHLVMDDGRVVTLGGPDTTYTPQERAEAQELYWRRSQPALGNALSLIQQAIEMGFKGRIAEVSPFLLMVRDPREYPSGGTKQDIPFSAFRSIDAADLMRVHNTVCAERLSDAFGTFWEGIRRQRNLFIHSVVPSGSLLRPLMLIDHVLTTCHALHPDKPWFSWRLEYAQNDETEAAFSLDPERVYGHVIEEFGLLLDHLPPRVSRDRFGFDHKARCYICPHCRADCENNFFEEAGLGRYAQLQPRGRTSTLIRCAVCGRSSPVVRERCTDSKCADVMMVDETGGLVCLGCGEEQYEEEAEGESQRATAPIKPSA